MTVICSYGIQTMASLGETIKNREIRQEMEESYLSYAMSVIVGRALPDIRDGLKPVHRRILYSMNEQGLRPGAKYRKSATVVGNVLGKYHPHGDTAAYESMVRLAQDFSMRYPLIDGQGNFGCFTKDTKVKLTDGRDLSFGELVEENEKGKKNYTFTVNKLGLISIAEIQSPRVTRKNAELIEVMLDNGQHIRCTPDHRFMLKDGSYKEAKNLSKQDSLMPLYQRLSEKTDRLNREGYALIYQPKFNTWMPTHHLSGSYNPIQVIYKTYAGQAYNHKAVSVRFIEEKEDVYDLTIEGSHNFALAAGVFVHNSIDGDSAAAYRYTEAKLTPIAMEMLADIDKETVDHVDNFDGTTKEPSVLPTRVPNLLLNGSMGIAVGMATNIPPHNLTEVMDGLVHLIDNPDASVKDLMQFVKGPDFPTGGVIYNDEDITTAYTTGRGGIVMRAKAEITESVKKGFQIVITEIPYQVNKSELIQKIAELHKDKKVDGIRDLRDESDKDGLRVVVDLKTDAFPKKVLNQLFKHTELQKTFHVNAIALIDGGLQPQVLGLKALLEKFIEHRRAVITRRTQFDLRKALDRAHILEGLKKALDHIDEIIKLIKASASREDAFGNLMQKFKFSDKQANAILDMRLQTLAGLERKKIDDELKEKKALIAELEDILAHPKKILGIIKQESLDLKAKFGDERRTRIVKGALKEIGEEDLIPEEESLFMLTQGGYIKRLPPDSLRAQKRGGKGLIGMETKEEDVISQFFVANTHDSILFFTNSGKVFQTKGHEVPEASRQSKGRALVNFLQVSQQEKITAAVPVSKKNAAVKYLIMTTANGAIKKVEINAFDNIRRNGMICIKLKGADELRWVKTTSGSDEIVLVTSDGNAMRFKEVDVRPMGRGAGGVIGMRLGKGAEVVGTEVVPGKSNDKALKILAVMANGYGKRTPLAMYKVQHRGGKGIMTAKITPKTGNLVSAHITSDEEESIIAISSKGQVIKTELKSISVLGRATQGVRIMRMDSGDKVASIVLV